MEEEQVLDHLLLHLDLQQCPRQLVSLHLLLSNKFLLLSLHLNNNNEVEVQV